MGDVAIKTTNGWKRGVVHYNNNGTIISSDGLDRVHNNAGNVVKFPQKRNCVLNLDPLTWVEERILSASSYISNPMTFSTGGVAKDVFGSMVTSTPTGSSFQVKEKDYWYVPNSNRNHITFNRNILTNSTFTIALTFKQFGTPTSWRNLTWFKNNDGLRFEWNDGGFLSIFGENNLISGNQNFTQLQSYQDDYVQLVMVVNGRSLKGYQNGILEIDSTLTRTLLTDNGNWFRIFSQRGGDNTGTYGCPVAIKHFQVWDVTLTDQEIADLRTFLFL